MDLKSLLAEAIEHQLKSYHLEKDLDERDRATLENLKARLEADLEMVEAIEHRI